jgi:hypothetical protein
VVVLVCIPTSSVKGFLFPTSLPPPVVSGVANDGYSKRGEVESQCGFDLHFFMARDGEHFFMCFLTI